TTLAFWPLDQRDIRPLLDRVNPRLHDPLIPFGPLRGHFGDRRRSVPLEPRGVEVAGRGLAREHDLEGPLAELDRRYIVVVRSSELCRLGIVEQAVGTINLPVELFLQRNHFATNTVVLDTEDV